MAKGENLKKRNWAFVLYPESAPEDWRERLKISGLMSAISPLHDRDVNPTGEPKKAHYHVLLVYSGPTTYGAVEKFTKSLNATIPQALESVRKGLNPNLTTRDKHLRECFVAIKDGANKDEIENQIKTIITVRNTCPAVLHPRWVSGCLFPALSASRCF